MDLDRLKLTLLSDQVLPLTTCDMLLGFRQVTRTGFPVRKREITDGLYQPTNSDPPSVSSQTSAIVTSTSTPGSILQTTGWMFPEASEQRSISHEMDVICLTTSTDACRSISLLWILAVNKASQSLLFCAVRTRVRSNRPTAFRIDPMCWCLLHREISSW